MPARDGLLQGRVRGGCCCCAHLPALVCGAVHKLVAGVTALVARGPRAAATAAAATATPAAAATTATPAAAATAANAAAAFVGAGRA